MKIKNKANKLPKILSIMFGVSLLVLPIFFTNVSRREGNANIDHNNSQFSQKSIESSLVDDYKFIDEAWASWGGTLVWKDTVGDVWTVGRGIWGQLGNGVYENNPFPTKIHDVDGKTNANIFGQGVTLSEVWSMRDTFVAKDTNGDIWTWGAGGRGQAGDGEFSNNTTPTKIHDVDGEINVFGQGVTIDEAWTTWASIIVKDTNGDIWSWGDDDSGELGYGNEVQDSAEPIMFHDVDGMTNVFGQDKTVERFWAMNSSIVVEVTGNDIWTWGRGDLGQVGDGELGNNFVPELIHDVDGETNVFGQGVTVDKIWTANDSTIVKDINKDIWTWGWGQYGQNGDGDAGNNLSPVKIHDYDATDSTNIFGENSTIEEIWMTHHSIIAKDTNDDIWSWGQGEFGQNADGDDDHSFSPKKIHEVNGTTNIFGTGVTVDKIWGSYGTFVARTTDGSIWSWGAGQFGQTGDGDFSNDLNPKKISIFEDQSINIVDVWVSDDTFRAIDENDVVWAWGRGDWGQNGDGELQNNNIPAKILVPGELSIEENSETSITITMDGFKNGTSVNNQATKATLTYGINGESTQTMEDNDLTDGVSFELNGLSTGVEYNFSIQYYKDTTAIGYPVEKSFANGFVPGNIAIADITTTTATIIADGFGNGTGNQEANKATLTYGVSGGTNQTMNDTDLTNGVSFNLTNLNPSTTYDLSITYYKDNAVVGTPITGTLVTNDVQFEKGTVMTSNISSSTAEVVVSEFQNGTGAQEATKATLTYGISGQQSKTMDDEDLSDGVSFKLPDLETGTYDLSIQYYKDSVMFDTPITSSFTTSPDSESLTQGNLVVSNITGTTATVSVNGFTNGTGANLATKATLTYDASGTRATMDDTNLSDGISFNLTGLNQGQDYNLSIAYFNDSNSQIGAPIISETPLIPQNPKSGLSTGAIIGIAVGVGGAALIGGGVGGFFLYKKKKGF